MKIRLKYDDELIEVEGREYDEKGVFKGYFAKMEIIKGQPATISYPKEDVADFRP